MRDLTRAITSYAILLNRPWCLDPARIEDQIPVWSRLIEQQTAEITLGDVESAIEQLLASESPQSIMPGHVVQQAGHIAKRRMVKARKIVDTWVADPQLVVLEAKQRYSRSSDVAQLRIDLDNMIANVAESELLDDAELTQFIADVNNGYEEIAA